MRNSERVAAKLESWPAIGSSRTGPFEGKAIVVIPQEDVTQAAAVIRKLEEALAKIAKNETTVFDEDTQREIVVSMTVDEMVEIGLRALELRSGENAL